MEDGSARRAFGLLWIGQSVSLFGSLISRTALPWTALIALNASAGQMALLGLCDLLPGLLIGLWVGSWLDRTRRRPVMLAADILRAVVVTLIPLAASASLLSFGLLLCIAPIVGAASAVFEIAYASYLPTLVSADQLTRANSRLSASASVAEIAAFGAAGWLVQWLGGPPALWIDAATFVVSAAALSLIRMHEPRPQPTQADHDNIDTGALEGIRVALSHPGLRPLLIGQIGLALGGGTLGTLYLLFVTRTLGFAPGKLGMIFAIGGVTSLLGAAVAEPLGKRFGPLGAARLGLALTAIGTVVNVFAPARRMLGYVCLIGNQCLTDPGWSIWEIHATAQRQSLAPRAALARVNAAFRTSGVGGQLLGYGLAGLLGDRIGPRAVVGLGAAIIAITVVLVMIVGARPTAVAPSRT